MTTLTPDCFGLHAKEKQVKKGVIELSGIRDPVHQSETELQLYGVVGSDIVGTQRSYLDILWYTPAQFWWSIDKYINFCQRRSWWSLGHKHLCHAIRKYCKTATGNTSSWGRAGQSILNEINPEYSLEGLILKLILSPPDVKSQLIRKDPDAGKDWRKEEKGKTEDKIVGWHDWLNGCEFGQAPGDSKGQGRLECCSSWGLKKSDMTEWLNNNREKKAGIYCNITLKGFNLSY